MKEARFTEEQIAFALRQAETGNGGGGGDPQDGDQRAGV
jgi:hypothetical protein